MSDYRELERQWEKYRFKKMFPRYLWLMASGSTAIIAALFLLNDTPRKRPDKPSAAQQHLSTALEHNRSALMTPISKAVGKKHPPLTLSPNYAALEKPFPAQKHESVQPKIPKTDTKKKASTLTISSNEEDLSALIDRFNRSNNPDLALMIAKRFYEEKDYDNAYNYALLANELNNDNEETWLLFAKTLDKLNKTEASIKVLKSYIQKSDSQQAKMLLDDIKAKAIP